jgi:hypothetical protein
VRGSFRTDHTLLLLLAALPLAALLPACSEGRGGVAVDRGWASLPDLGLGQGELQIRPNQVDFNTQKVELGAQPVNAYQVRVLYLVPSDRSVQSAYQLGLEASARHVQVWLRDQLGDNRSVTFATPAVVTKLSTRTASWFASNPVSGVGSDGWFLANAREEAKRAGASADDAKSVWLVYVDANPACGQIGSTASGHLAVYGSSDLHGMAGQPTVPLCPGDKPASLSVCRWYGGMAYWLVFSLGVPQPAACVNQQPDCPSSTFMWAGLHAYPKTSLLESDRAILRKSPFVSKLVLYVNLPPC